MEQNLMKQAAFASFLIERDFERKIPPYVIARAAIHESSYGSNSTCAVDYLKDVCDCQLLLAEFSGRISFFPFDPQPERLADLYKQPLTFGINGFDFSWVFLPASLLFS